MFRERNILLYIPLFELINCSNYIVPNFVTGNIPKEKINPNQGCLKEKKKPSMKVSKFLT